MRSRLRRLGEHEASEAHVALSNLFTHNPGAYYRTTTLLPNTMYATLYPYLVYIPCMPDNAAAAVLAELHCQLGRDDAVVRDIHGVR